MNSGILLTSILDFPGYSLQHLMDFFEVNRKLTHDALDDARNLFFLARNMDPYIKKCKPGVDLSWYGDFLMSSFKHVSYFF